jgi:hypothetical protein
MMADFDWKIEYLSMLYPHFKTFTSHSLYKRLKTTPLAILFQFSSYRYAYLKFINTGFLIY